MNQPISSLQNERVKYAVQLQKKARLRRQERKIVLEGVRLVGDAIAQGAKPTQAFYDPARVDGDILGQLSAWRVPSFSVTPEVLKHISDTQQPQSVIAIFPIPTPALPQQATRVLILDAVRDPGNMGTILRSAGASGVELVLLAPECVDPYNPKVLRAGMGAHFRVPIVEANWAEIRAYLGEMPIYVASGEGALMYDAVDWVQAWALVVGNEAHGVEASMAHLDVATVRIPMAGATESLNAAVASAVILFEAQRQRLTGGGSGGLA